MLLTGSTQAAKGPRAFIMGSGRFLGNDANGGWVSAFDSKQVIGIYTRLPTPETLLERFREIALPDGIVWRSRLDAQGPEFFLDPYRDLLTAMTEAVDQDLGMLAGLV
jgi:hypothetical protein